MSRLLAELRAPRHGPGVCVRCFNFTREPDYELCYACATGEQHLDAMVPIAYSVAHEQLHHDLVRYKRYADPWVEMAVARLALILGRFLASHEACLASTAGATAFDVVATVPSGQVGRDEFHPLRRIVGEMVESTAERHERLLRRSSTPVRARAFDPARYRAVRPLTGANVLLIDDTWTTGASAQSAAAALKAAGAACVGAVVIGRHLNREWFENDQRLRHIARPLRRSICALCADAPKVQAA
jgi:predicted amidophosphoribosyltransferase